jgi:hypothetical protein
MAASNRWKSMMSALSAAVLIAGTARAQSPKAVPPPLFATFTFADGKPVRTFLTDVETAEILLQIAEGERKDGIPNGILLDDRPRKSPYDPNWSWHFKPDSVRMADVTIEVCDATPTYIEEHMDEWFRGEKEARWCGWSAKLVKVEPLVYGDADFDGRVTVADAVNVLRWAISVVFLNEAEIVAGDVYPRSPTGGRPGDGVHTVSDVIMILRHVVGLEAIHVQTPVR